MIEAYQPMDFDWSLLLADLFEKASASTCTLKPAAPLSDISAGVSLWACWLYLHCTSAVVMELICWWWIIHDWWCESVSQTAAPVWLPWRWTACHVIVIQTPNGMGILVHILLWLLISRVNWEGIQVKQPILSKHIWISKNEGNDAIVVQQWLKTVTVRGAEQPSTHTVAHSDCTDEPALSEATLWDLLLAWHVAQFGTEERSEPTMASCSAPLEQIHPRPASR